MTLHRDFADYVINEDDGMITGLKEYFKYALLPAEAFFHIALRNSRFCGTVINNNLHLTNWNRKRGCKCQQKAIVDWCGCSPNDIKASDIPKLKDTENRPDIFFARKFEAIVTQVNQIYESSMMLPNLD